MQRRKVWLLRVPPDRLCFLHTTNLARSADVGALTPLLLLLTIYVAVVMIGILRKWHWDRLRIVLKSTMEIPINSYNWWDRSETGRWNKV